MCLSPWFNGQRSGKKKKKSFPKLSLKKSRYSCLKSCCLKRQASNFSTLLGTDLFSLVTGEAGGHYSWHSLSGLFQLRVFLEEASAEPGLQYLVAVAPGTHSLINWLFGKWGLCSQCADPRVQHRGSRQKSLFQSLSLKQVYLYTLKVAAYGSCFHSVYIQMLIEIQSFGCAKSLQSCLTLCDSMDCSLPGSSVPGLLQSRILEWVAIPSSSGSSQPRDHQASISCIGRQVLYHQHHLRSPLRTERSQQTLNYPEPLKTKKVTWTITKV